MNKITRIHEFLESYKTLDPSLKHLVRSIRDDHIRKLFELYAENGIENYQMKPNEDEVHVLNKDIGII